MYNPRASMTVLGDDIFLIPNLGQILLAANACFRPRFPCSNIQIHTRYYHRNDPLEMRYPTPLSQSAYFIGAAS